MEYGASERKTKRIGCMIEKELEIWLDKHGYEDAFEEDGLVITGKQDSNADTYTIQKKSNQSAAQIKL